MQYVSYRIIKDLTSPSMFYYFSYLFPFFIIIFSISYIKTKKKFKKDRLQRLEVNNDVYLWLLLVTTYNRIRFSEDLWWGGVFLLFWMHRAGAGDMTSRRDYKRNVVIFSFISIFFLLCCDENLWWITFSLCLLYMNEALFQKYIFLNFLFVITYYLWFAKEYVPGRSMSYVWVALFLSHASKFNAKKI